MWNIDGEYFGGPLSIEDQSCEHERWYDETSTEQTQGPVTVVVSVHDGYGSDVGCDRNQDKGTDKVIMVDGDGTIDKVVCCDE